MSVSIVTISGGLPHWKNLEPSFLFLLMSCARNVSRFGSIVVLGDPIFANVLRLGVVASQGEGLQGNDFLGEGSKMG